MEGGLSNKSREEDEQIRLVGSISWKTTSKQQSEHCSEHLEAKQTTLIYNNTYIQLYHYLFLFPLI